MTNRIYAIFRFLDGPNGLSGQRSTREFVSQCHSEYSFPVTSERRSAGAPPLSYSYGHCLRWLHKGYIWGTPVEKLISAVPSQSESNEGQEGCYDLIILSDLIFNHSQVCIRSEHCNLTLADEVHLVILHSTTLSSVLVHRLSGRGLRPQFHQTHQTPSQSKASLTHRAS